MITCVFVLALLGRIMGFLKDEPASQNMVAGCNLCVLVNPLVWILWLLDFLCWLVYFVVVGWVFALMNCVNGKPDGILVKSAGEDVWTCNYNAEATGELITGPTKDESTAYDCFNAAFTKFPNRKCMGTRTYLGTHRREPGHKIVKKVFGETQWLTYKEVQARAEAFGRGLIGLGMTPCPSSSKSAFEESDAKDTLLLWEDTCADWMTCLSGCFSQSLVVATSYATLGVDGVAEAVNQCECAVVVCNRSKVKELIKARASLIDPSRLTTIIYTNLNQGGVEIHGGEREEQPLQLNGMKLQPDELGPLELEVPDGLQVLHYDDVVALGNSPNQKTPDGEMAVKDGNVH